jgi:hypothetical protein
LERHDPLDVCMARQVELHRTRAHARARAAAQEYIDRMDGRVVGHMLDATSHMSHDPELD